MEESLKVGPGKGRSLPLMRRDTTHNRRSRERMKGWEGKRYGGDWVREDRKRDIKSCAIYAKIICCVLQEVQGEWKKNHRTRGDNAGEGTTPRKEESREGTEKEGVEGGYKRRKVSGGGRGKD